MRTIALCFVVSCLGWIMVGLLSVEGGAPASAADIAVWSHSDGTARQIVVSRKEADGSWSVPDVLSQHAGQNVTPAVAKTPDNRVWVVWTTLSAEGSYLSISHSQTNGGWRVPERLNTGLRSNTAPDIWVDPNGVLWIVWSGNDGGNDDIFAMHGDGRTWSEPERIHPANSVPDVLPAIEPGANGMPSVKWSRFCDGRYRTFSSAWQGTAWSTPVEIAEESIPTAAVPSLDMPPTVGDRDKVVVLEEGNTRGLSLRDRYLMFQKRLDGLNRK